MTKAAASTRTCILLPWLLLGMSIAILASISEAALIQQQQQQQQQQQPYKNIYQQSYTQNALDEQRKTGKDTTNLPYDHVDDLGNRVLDRLDRRYPDGSYEYRFELSDGTARYERGYFIKIDKTLELVVVGYYSYRMPDGQFLTVFYNADRYGYRQNRAITREAYPDLPRTIEVPQIKDESATATTSRPSFVTSTTTRRSRT